MVESMIIELAKVKDGELITISNHLCFVLCNSVYNINRPFFASRHHSKYDWSKWVALEEPSAQYVSERQLINEWLNISEY